ncbi:methyl-accepting chemotaxis protein (MCP) signaling protein [Rhizobium azibense]|nr:methyl-accepting chemotaxis protein (MCP) signaling protein [Rhizobium azibense]
MIDLISFAAAADLCARSLTSCATKSVNQNVDAIAQVSRVQADGLKEINFSVGKIESPTQQNAALVEESTSAVNNLAKETASLFEMLSRFQIAGGPAKTSRSEEPTLYLAAA